MYHYACTHFGLERMLHVCYMYVTCMLHACYMYVTCVLHVCYMHVACDFKPIIINVIAGAVDVCKGFLCME